VRAWIGARPDLAEDGASRIGRATRVGRAARLGGSDAPRLAPDTLRGGRLPAAGRAERGGGLRSTDRNPGHGGIGFLPETSIERLPVILCFRTELSQAALRDPVRRRALVCSRMSRRRREPAGDGRQATGSGQGATVSKALEKARQQFQAGHDKQGRQHALRGGQRARTRPPARSTALLDSLPAIRCAQRRVSAGRTANAHIKRARKPARRRRAGGLAARAPIRRSSTDPSALPRWAAQTGPGLARDRRTATSSRLSLKAISRRGGRSGRSRTLRGSTWSKPRAGASSTWCYRCADQVQTSILRGADLLGGDAVEGARTVPLLFRARRHGRGTAMSFSRTAFSRRQVRPETSTGAGHGFVSETAGLSISESAVFGLPFDCCTGRTRAQRRASARRTRTDISPPHRRRSSYSQIAFAP